MEVKQELLKYINVRGLIIELLLNGVVKPKLAELVAKSENKVDDAVLAVALPLVDKLVVDLIDDQLKKLLK